MVHGILGKIRDIFRVLMVSLAWRSRGSWARQGSAGYPAVAVVPASGFWQKPPAKLQSEAAGTLAATLPKVTHNRVRFMGR